MSTDIIKMFSHDGDALLCSNNCADVSIHKMPITFPISAPMLHFSFNNGRGEECFDKVTRLGGNASTQELMRELGNTATALGGKEFIYA